MKVEPTVYAAWKTVQIARHPERPQFLDYVGELFSEFDPLHGDRLYGDDGAMIGGLARFDGQPVMVMGQHKGRSTRERLQHNFGMCNPEGYRKSLRLLEMAEHYGLPVFTFIDTMGAYPGVGAEERGQAEAIARSTEKCLELGVPLIAAVVGEGGSGGAVALAAANRVLMFEHAVYSVISPEGCASILWRTAEKAADAAEAMRITAQDLKRLGVIDEIIAEPAGGAHRSATSAIDALGAAIGKSLDSLSGLSRAELKQDRRKKFLAMGGL